MPIKIHHGPPGSYKTAGAIGDDFLREARAGRVIVTNCRGVSRERTLEQFPDLPESFDVIHVDDKTTEGRHKWATWFHWVPHGAFILVDEVQDIWPKRWKESDIRALDYPGGIEKATADDRPKDWEQALDKHRHYNWDMTLTCPSYAKVRDDVKGIADMAYKHKDLALIGWTGRYIEGAHAADDTGKNASDFVNVVNKKVPAYVFKLYDSTQTGLFSGTKSGISLLKNPRVMLLLAIVLGLGVFISSRPLPKVVGGSASASDAVSPSGSKSGASGSAPSGAVAGASVSGGPSDPLGDPFAQGDPHIIASFKAKPANWRYAIAHSGATYTQEDLLDLGYAITPRGSCGLEIEKGEFKRLLVCAFDESKAVSAAERSARHETVDRSFTAPKLRQPFETEL